MHISLEWPNPYLMEPIEERAVSHEEEDTTKPDAKPVVGPSRVRKAPSWLKDYVV